MGKRSPRDTTPSDRIIDWENEAERAFIEMQVVGEAERWYDLKENAQALRDDFLGDDFFDVPAAEPGGPKKEGEQQPDGHYWWPSLSPRFGLRVLPYEMRQNTLRTEGLAFRKKYDEGARRVGTPREFFNLPEEDVEFYDTQDENWLDNTFVCPESDRQYNTGLPGALTAEGYRLMDDLPSTPVVEEFFELPISGAVFGIMKRRKRERLERIRKKREDQEN